MVHANSATLRQVCGASTVLDATTQLDVEVTSKVNPQPSKAPLTITGQVYEMTATGRVGVAGAEINIDWANDGPFLDLVADSNGYYTACGIPANRPMGFSVLPPRYEYNGTYGWHVFSTDATRDFELKR
jgi:hypothetical protein